MTKFRSLRNDKCINAQKIPEQEMKTFSAQANDTGHQGWQGEANAFQKSAYKIQTI